MTDIKALIGSIRARGLSQSEIARRTGIPQPRVSRWEAGNCPPAASDTLKLLELASELGGTEGAPNPNPTEVRDAA